MGRDDVEIRKNDDGTIDEVLFYAAGRAVMHLEQMGKGLWWLGIYPDGKRVSFNLADKGYLQDDER